MNPTWPVVLPWDPAIDHAQSDLAAYIQTRDIKKLVFLPELRPMTFHLRRITQAQRGPLYTFQTREARAEKAFRVAVVKIENAVFEDGSQFPVWEPQRMREGGTSDKVLDLWTDAEIDLVDAGTMCDVGDVAWQRSFLSRRITAGYELPPMSSQTWRAATTQLAAQAASTAETGTSE